MTALVRPALGPTGPLFAAPDLALLRRKRDELRARIDRLRPCEHRRIVLQARLQDVVTEILALEQALFETQARSGARGPGGKP